MVPVVTGGLEEIRRTMVMPVMASTSTNTGMKTRNHNKIRGLIFCLILTTFSLALFAQDNPKEPAQLSIWFQENKQAARYLSYQAELELLFRQLEEQRLPHWILFDKLAEGVSKKVKGETLVSALQREYSQLLDISIIFRELEIQPGDRNSYEETLKTLSLYLSGGLGLDLLKPLIKMNLAYHSDNANLTILCEAILKVKQTSNLPDEELLLLADSLLNSIIPAAGYLSVSSLFVKAKISHLKEQTLLELIITTLARGGGLIQLNDEFNRRTRK